ncbi:Rab5/RabF-family small GTPase [Planoprotostelium fungivorum]|uniref:Rab5/RabF-family small GTPase n=1 Tax=Planoprotostelium fungivorum TaxID=1890364 RepID=A0A2P6N6C0_9EUKA|nr:Rab5/RabF-family small GTPase [Planoprotostelium fungivorum]
MGNVPSGEPSRPQESLRRAPTLSEIPLPGTDVWSNLQDDLILRILSFLTPLDLCRTVREVIRGQQNMVRGFFPASKFIQLRKPLYEAKCGMIYLNSAKNTSYKFWYQTEVTGKTTKALLLNPQTQRKCCVGVGNKDLAQATVKLASQQYEQMSPTQKLHEGAKLVMLGDSSAGKSSLVLRFCRGTFSPYHEATIGASFLVQQIVVDDVPVKFQIWDTAGSERFHSLAPMYYRGALAAVVVYDVTNHDSFEKVQKWVDELQAQRGDPPVIIIVGNKSDLIESKGREVKKELAQNLAADKGSLWMECSAKTGHNVVELFSAVGRKLCERAKAEEEQRAHRYE